MPTTSTNTGSNYIGLTSKWNYEKEYVDVSMLKYITKSFERSQHPKHIKPLYSPHEHYTIKFIKKGKQ